MNGRWPGIGIARAAAVPWTPADLGAGLLAWFDPNDLLTLTLNGSTVQEWRSKVGTAKFIQNNTAIQPTYDSVGSQVKILGDLQYMESTTIGTMPNLTLAVLGAAGATTVTEVAMILTAGVDSTWALGFIYEYKSVSLTGSNKLAKVINSGSNAWDIGGTGAVGTASMVQQGPEASLVIISAHPGSKATLRTTNSTSNLVFQSNVNHVSISYAYPGWLLGAYYKDGGGIPNNFGFRPMYKDIVFLDRPLTTDEVERLEGYILHKAGLASLRLYPSHPYKNAPPTK